MRGIAGAASSHESVYANRYEGTPTRKLSSSGDEHELAELADGHHVLVLETSKMRGRCPARLGVHHDRAAVVSCGNRLSSPVVKYGVLIFSSVAEQKLVESGP